MSHGDEHRYGGPRRSDDGPYEGGQTRTRLPDWPGDPYGGARRGSRSSFHGLITAVAVIVLLIAAIAFANRSDGSSSTASDRNGSDRPKAAATAASGTRPVETKKDGIPSGFARTEQGAQSAAANYSVVLGSADMFDTDRRHRIVNALYTPEVAARRQADLDRAYANEDFLKNIGLDKDGKAPAGQTFVSRVIPVGTKITSLRGDKATVSVWYTSLFGLSGKTSTNPVTESWYTTTYQLKWVDDDWKIIDFQQEDGPVPVGRDQRASTADDMTKAVEEYGGFTYAR
ncbi:hypothetical protein STXM2123_5722 [Streptomyces sp. F-3]|uniref:DUF8175 domain-containing protein n=1 Tax=Streptomyces thermogriseus TaxID=75292 RepID=A0ABP4DSI3_9ACTN|nr:MULTISPECIES: hypothetical protein [unclassified Streptomyces]MDN5385173.1 hypothetical protein [Streptomyces sp. LB8]GAT85021.1 hypothetical protein STXM2123_5722 [Streptomyces sp. F-3]